MLETIIASDDESIKQVYGILDKELDSAAESRKEYSQLASRVLDDLSKGLSDPNLSEEEKSKIRTQEIEVTISELIKHIKMRTKRQRKCMENGLQ